MFRKTRLPVTGIRQLAASLALAASASAQLPLQKGDTIGIIGNGLADRMQHDGWVETILQSKLAGHNLSLRNLAISGDTVTSRPRTKGVPSPDDHLATCKADVVFAFFGYNVSGISPFRGQSSRSPFRGQSSRIHIASAL